VLLLRLRQRLPGPLSKRAGHFQAFRLLILPQRLLRLRALGLVDGAGIEPALLQVLLGLATSAGSVCGGDPP
jgi:hypothetical protein